jgi:hypothetical protein
LTHFENIESQHFFAYPSLQPLNPRFDPSLGRKLGTSRVVLPKVSFSLLALR